MTVLRDAVSTSLRMRAFAMRLAWRSCAKEAKMTRCRSLNAPTELAPDQAHYAYVYAVGLHSAGQADDAIAVLKDNLAKHPTDRESLLALVTFNRDGGNIASALEYAQRLAQDRAE